MPWQLSPFADVGLDADALECLLSEHDTDVRPRLERLWSYYRNPDGGVRRRSGARACSGANGESPGPRAATLAQASGLPERFRSAHPDRQSPEIVIENDIGWRTEALVDFLFGKPVRLVSMAKDVGLRSRIDELLERVWAESGGLTLMQDMALLGCVYGSADIVVRPGHSAEPLPKLELVEAPRAIPVLDAGDYRRVRAYIIRARHRTHMTRRDGEIVEILSASHRQVYIDGALVVDEVNAAGELPLVHIQNASQPYRYEGLSDVEPLIPLQDELNTRLSDRAHRVTLQSFNMYLAKGLELTPVPGSGNAGRGPSLRVSPGQVWTTENVEAEIQAFGGDGNSPSEVHHIEELREAMDKTSGVSPVVIGVIREKLGHLSSENAIRITLAGILGKTERKRTAYGRGIERVCGLVLAMLDRSGVLRTREEDRAITLEWPDPLPTDERTRLAAALMKRDLGVPTETLLRELGYASRGDGALSG